MAVQVDPATRDRAHAVADTPLPLENGDRLPRGCQDRGDPRGRQNLSYRKRLGGGIGLALSR